MSGRHMEESYERQLESALAAFPHEGCLVALVATIALDEIVQETAR